MNYGFQPQAYRYPRDNAIIAEKAQVKVEDLKKLHEHLQQDLSFVQSRMQYYANQKRIEGPTFKEGDKVYLVRRNIKTKRPSDKLDYKKLGPFLISEVILKTNYRLSLPETMRIHPVFYISLLELAHPDADTKLVRFQDSIEVIPENEEEYEVE